MGCVVLSFRLIHRWRCLLADFWGTSAHICIWKKLKKQCSDKNIICRQSIFIRHLLFLNYVKVFWVQSGGGNVTQSKLSIMETNPPEDSHKQSTDLACFIRVRGSFCLSIAILNEQRSFEIEKLAQAILLLLSQAFVLNFHSFY